MLELPAWVTEPLVLDLSNLMRGVRYLIRGNWIDIPDGDLMALRQMRDYGVLGGKLDGQGEHLCG